MNEHEKMYLCGCICKAAKSIGFKIRLEDRGENLVGYTWVDLMNGRREYTCNGASDNKWALFNACIAMQNMLAI